MCLHILFVFAIIKYAKDTFQSYLLKHFETLIITIGISCANRSKESTFRKTFLSPYSP